MAQAGYTKRPLWQWIIIYVVVGAILYFGIYYFFLRGRGGYASGVPGYSSGQGLPQSGTGY